MKENQIDNNYHSVGSIDKFEVGTAKRIVINDIALAVYRLEDGFYATSDLCPHMLASLAYGKINDNIVQCPRHGARFDIKTGRVLSLPSVRGVRAYPVKVEGNELFVCDQPINEAVPEIIRFGL